MLRKSYLKIKSLSKIIFKIIPFLLLMLIILIRPISKLPNVILITVDALRVDHLSCYGYLQDTSPNIDKFTKKGVLFTQAISPAAWTAPSIISILTSNYPYIFGLFKEGKDWGSISVPGIYALPQILRDKGYQTCLISSHCGLNKIVGLKQNFNIFNCWINGKDDRITHSAIAYLKENRNKPFFLWIHYMGPHAPYLPPFPYDMLYLDMNHNHRDVAIENIPQYAALDGNTDIDYYISQYDGEIAFTDEQIGILLKEIKRLNLDKKTLIVLTADHGENLGEHNSYFDHGGNLYDTILKVPLIMVYDDIIPKGRVIEEQVSLIDIMPTILDILDIKVNNKMDGVTLKPLISDTKRNYIKYAFSERFFEQREASIRTREWKLIYNLNTNRYQLYNLKNDSGELNNLVSMEKEEFEFLREKLNNWFKEAESIVAKTETGQSFDEETKVKLRSLGYLQ